MNLKNLTNILKSGNVALGQKLQNLLTEDCQILEYTDDSVLFQKNNFLVLAKFKHNLSEAKMTSDSIVDNEVIYISAKETEKALRESLVSLVDHLVEDNYIGAEDELKAFCEQYFQYYIIKSRFPIMFTENLVKKAPGFKLRKSGFKAISNFKSDLFALLTLKENKTLEIAEYTSLIENSGSVLFLGKPTVKSIVLDTVLGNESLAEAITDKLFLVASTLNESNVELQEALDNNYDLEKGSFESEDPDVVASEDFDSPEEVESDFPVEEEEPAEFSEFDPSKLSDEEVKELHRSVLKSILSSMEEFVTREANNPENSEMAGDMDSTLKSDLEALEDMNLSDETLSQIEARWQPIISYFLDSDLYTPEQDLGEEEFEVKSSEDEGHPVEDVEPTAEPAGEDLGVKPASSEVGAKPASSEVGLPGEEEEKPFKKK
jgi:hypothetical protein